MFERKTKFHVTYFEVKNKRIRLQCFAEKTNIMLQTKKLCNGSKEKRECHVWHFNVKVK